MWSRDRVGPITWLQLGEDLDVVAAELNLPVELLPGELVQPVALPGAVDLQQDPLGLHADVVVLVQNTLEPEHREPAG